MTDPNLAPLVKIARALGSLRGEAVFVGGSVVGLLLTDPAAQRIRPTDDIDLIVEIATRSAFARLEERLRKAGFRNDPQGPICRWLYQGTKVDVMPDDSKILGFSNPWYREAFDSALTRDLANDLSIRLISAPCFLATKLTAFQGRGNGDFLASPDLEDLIAVIDGRDSLMAETADASAKLRQWIAGRFRELLSDEDFLSALPGHLPADSVQAGRTAIVLDRLRSMAGTA